MSLKASQITSLTTVYSTVYSGADQKEHQSSASLAFVGGIHRSPVNSPHKGPVTRNVFPFDDIIMVFLFVSKSTPRYFSGLAKPLLKFSHRLLISPLSFMRMQPPMPWRFPTPTSADIPISISLSWMFDWGNLCVFALITNSKSTRLSLVHTASCVPQISLWRLEWEHFPCYWPFVWGIHRSRWFPRTKASDAKLWCFLWSASE